MSKSRFVFFGAKDGQVTVSINQVLVGVASDSEQLVAILQENGVTLADEMFQSSSVDFAAEEGFADDNGAYNIIEPALDLIAE
jgi:acyl-CoA thioesterase